MFSIQTVGPEFYVTNFYMSGRVVINTRLHRKELTEVRIPGLEKCYKIKFTFKGGKSSSGEQKQKQENLTTQENTVNKDSIERSNEPTQNNPLQELTVDQEIPLIIAENNKDGAPETREIITHPPKQQRDFNKKIEAEQIKISEEINQLRHKQEFELNKLKQEMTELHEKDKNILKTKIEGLQEENKKLKQEIELIKLNSVANNSTFQPLTEEYEEMKANLKEITKIQLKQEIDIHSNKTQINESIQDINKAINECEQRLKENENGQSNINKKLTDFNSYLESLNDNGNPWVQIVNNKEVLVEQLNQTQEKGGEDKECIDLIILGDSITKYIIPERITKGPEEKSINFSKSGAKVKHVYDQFREFKELHGDTVVSNVIVHVGTNHLPRDDPCDVLRKISKLLLFLQKEMKESTIYFSAIIPKFGSQSFRTINFINREIQSLCSSINKMYFISHLSFTKLADLNHELYRADKIHANRKGLRQLAWDFMDAVHYKRFWK